MMTNPKWAPYGAPPTLEEIEAVAREAMASLPDELRGKARGLVLRVEEFPDEETEQEMGLESPFDLLGLYRGLSLDKRSIVETPEDIDMIFLYRRPILDYWCDAGEHLSRIIRHVVIHEIGHHFGFSDDDMERIEAEA